MTVAAERTKPTAKWMHSARFDAPLALAWIPFSVAAIAIGNDTEALSIFVGVVLIAALAHQPLTLALVYGDPKRREERRALYRWSPPILIAAIIIGGLVALKLVLLVALLWNLEHHIMQRFGTRTTWPTGMLAKSSPLAASQISSASWGGNSLSCRSSALIP